MQYYGKEEPEMQEVIIRTLSASSYKGGKLTFY